MTDNFDNYRELIELMGGLPDNNEKGNLDKYYVIELIRRGKDNPDMSAANYHFRNYYIYSWKDLEKYEQEIEDICSLLHLRAYCSVNYKLMSQVALDTLAESARRIAAHDFKQFNHIFESCSGKFVHRGDNLWVVDVDNDIDRFLMTKYINSMKSKYSTNVVYTMPTKSGYHLICRPFNEKQYMDGFKCWQAKVEEIPTIKKNHLTLLYENL